MTARQAPNSRDIVGQTSQKRRASRSLKAPLAAGVALMLLLAGCSSDSPSADDSPTETRRSEQQVSDPTNILQNVNVNVDHTGSVKAINSTNIYVNEHTHQSSTKDVKYKVSDVVNDVPVRVSVQYQSNKGNGTDLNELKGYSGPLTIKISVENLSVKPQEITYDAGGSSHKKKALVGVPLTVAASTVLENSTPNQVVAGSSLDAKDPNATNGVISSNSDGKAVVQWGTIITPPTTEANASLVLKMDAKDFKVPNFDIAVQPGFADSLSSENVLTNGFNKNDQNQMALLQRTMKVVSDVNGTLLSASDQINELRKNLDSTAGSLGNGTAENLKGSNEKLTKRMEELSNQIRDLKTDLSKTAQTNNSQLITQLERTVGSLDSALGDTSVHPSVKVNASGNSCTVDRSTPHGGSSVYSNLVQLADVLGSYAQANAGCQRELSGTLSQIIGPKDPGPEQCRDHGGDSVTCALYGTSASVQANLIGLTVASDSLLNDMRPDYLRGANKNYSDLQASIQQLSDYLNSQNSGSADTAKVQETIKNIRGNVNSLKESSNSLQEGIGRIYKTSQEAQAELTGEGSAQEQNQKLADQLCELSTERGGHLSPDEVARLRSYLTATPCGAGGGQQPQPAPEPNTPNTPNDQPSAEPSAAPSTSAEPSASASTSASASPSEGASGEATTPAAVVENANEVKPHHGKPMDQRIVEQQGRWRSVSAETDPNAEKGLAADAKRVNARVNDLDGQLKALEDEANKLGDTNRDRNGEQEKNISALKQKVDALTRKSDDLGQNLKDLAEQHNKISETVKAAFKDSSDKTAQQVNDLIGKQIRVISDRGQSGNRAVEDAFSRSINQLVETSDNIVVGAGNSVENQRKDLSERTNNVRAALDGATQQSLGLLDQRTSAATRDLEGSSALLYSDLNKIMLDLGDSKVEGAGLLGSLKSNSAKAGSADYQLALASQNAQGYTSIRSEDIANIQLRQAQFKESLKSLEKMKPFHLSDAGNAEVRVLYTFRVGEAQNG